MDEKTRRLINPEPDWLDRAAAPSELKMRDRLLMVGAVVLVLLTCVGAAAFFLR